MKLKINENLLNKIDIKKQYPNLIINRKEIKIRKNENAYKSVDNPPIAFSFSLEQKNVNIFNLMNKKYLFNKNNSNLKKKYRNLYDKKNEDNIKIKLFNKATSTNDSIDSINKEINKENNVLIKSFNKKNDNNKLIIHHKLVILNKIQDSKRAELCNQSKRNFLINSASAKKYQTIFTKYNNKEIQQKDKSSEQGQNFELLSSKYRNKIECLNEAQTPKKIFTNEEIKKVELHNQSLNDKYLNTDISINKNKTLSVFLPKFINMPNIDNLKNFQKKPTFYCQKDSVKKNINLIVQKNKNDVYKNMIPIAAKFWNSKNQNRNNYNSNHMYVKSCNKYMQNNGIKYVSVNLNILTKIPNRLIHVDSHGNKIKHNNNTGNKTKTKRIQSQSDTFRALKRNLLNKIRFINNKDKDKDKLLN